MKRILVLSTIALCSAANGQPIDMQRAKEPIKIVPTQDARPVKPPAGTHRQVAVLSIELDVVDGAVRYARVTSSKRIASYAPKVFARAGGEWEVIIEGATQKSFYVENPALREAEGNPASGGRYQRVGETGLIEWPLVVPLYHGERGLGARAITIRNTRTGATILRTKI